MVVFPSCVSLWIPAYAGMTVGFAKVSIKGEGILLVGVVLLAARSRFPHLWIADQVRNDGADGWE